MMKDVLKEKGVALQFISHYTERHSYLDSVRMALEGGCRWVQLRMKDAAEEDFLTVGAEVRRLCDEHRATFVIDDHVELVRRIGADGVHLGKKDMPVAEARKILGSGYIIGGTANDINDVRMHYEASADYIGCGPFRFTTTKKGLAPVLGLEGYLTMVRQMQEEKISIPIVAIGGITVQNIPSIMRTGVDGIALSGAVLRASDPVAEMRRAVEAVRNPQF